MDKILESYLKNKNTDSVKYEFELRFKHYFPDRITRSDYNNVIPHVGENLYIDNNAYKRIQIAYNTNAFNNTNLEFFVIQSYQNR